MQRRGQVGRLNIPGSICVRNREFMHISSGGTIDATKRAGTASAQPYTISWAPRLERGLTTGVRVYSSSVTALSLDNRRCQGAGGESYCVPGAADRSSAR